MPSIMSNCSGAMRSNIIARRRLWLHARLAQRPAGRARDCALDFRGTPRCIDDRAALRLASCDRQKGVAASLMDRQRLLFEAIRSALPTPYRGAPQTFGRIEIEHQRQIGHYAVDGHA